jgi:hypothetical protein
MLAIPAFTLLSCLAYSTLKMEAMCFSEMSVDFQQTTWHYIPDDNPPLPPKEEVKLFV